MNRLFVANKPIFLSSNRFLTNIKRELGVKKAGFSGTLDPFAKGTLVVATGEYTKLFNYLNLSPKVYRATLWLGAKSRSLDIEMIESVQKVFAFSEQRVEDVLLGLKGEFKYRPPSFSAKKIGGVRAYKLARDGVDTELKEITSTIYDIKLLNYCHPFLSFEVSVQKGGYVRSIGEEIAKRLGCAGSLSFLHRTKEGAFEYNGGKKLNPLSFLDLPKNRYNAEYENVLLGRKLATCDFEHKEDGSYLLSNDEYISVVSIEDSRVKYLLNRISLC
ncbi:MAG: tRNA pseudouridine(55) synthase TruB [Campylobacterales bacterium]